MCIRDRFLAARLLLLDTTSTRQSVSSRRDVYKRQRLIFESSPVEFNATLHTSAAARRAIAVPTSMYLVVLLITATIQMCIRDRF